MFTLEQITKAHDTLGKMDTFYQYIKALNSMGVEKFETYVSDGHSVYFGSGQKVKSAPQHEPFNVSETSNKGLFFEQFGIHLQGKTSPIEMYESLADSDIEKWIVDIKNMKMSYYDKQGNELLIERIKE